MAAKVIDLDTSVSPAVTIQPTRYTLTDTDTVRVVAYLELAEILGGDPFDLAKGFDLLTALDNATSDAERAAIVSEIVLSIAGVSELATQPVVTESISNGAPKYTITVDVLTDFGGEFTLAVP